MNRLRRVFIIFGIAALDLHAQGPPANPTTELIFVNGRPVSIGAQSTAQSTPTAVSVTPSSGSGSSQTFALVYSDPDGFANLSTTQLNIAPTLRPFSACYVNYDRSSNVATLINDAGTAAVGSVVLGSSASIQNSQCMLSGTGSSVMGSGNNLTVSLALTFLSGFAGTKAVNLSAQDIGGMGSGWQQLGTWTVTPSGGDHAPTAVSVTPASGSGFAQTFALVYSDPDGFADISQMQVNIAASLSAANACYVNYNPSSNSASLVDDAGTAIVGSVVLGSSATVQNSQCILSGMGSSSVGSGNNRTVNLALTFEAAFAGPKVVNLSAMDLGGLSSGWQQLGTWTVQ